jgi:hypothetical protein
MSTAANKNNFAACFVGPIESADTSKACLGLYNTNNDSATSTITPLPYFEFTADVTPGTVGEQSFMNMDGKLAITEICYNPEPENEKYEYVEVKNVSENLVDIKNYYVYRFGFSNGGSYKATGVKQLLGYSSQACAKLVKHSLANVTGDTILASDEVALLWFASATSKDEDISAFKSYWTDQGADMTNVTVIKVPV